MRKRDGGFLDLMVLSWLLAGASLVFAAFVWLKAEPAAEPHRQADDASHRAEVNQLRLALAASGSEAQALRDELDRLVDLYRTTLKGEEGGGAAWTPQTPAASAPADADDSVERISRAELADTAYRYRDALSRAAAGDEAAADEAYAAVMQLLKGGPAAFPALKEAYLSTTDPDARAIMARAFMSSLGPQAQEFIASQLLTETDPRVREELARRASHMSSPSRAPVFREAFLETLGSAREPETRAAAVRGLRHLRRDEEVQEALLAAASDPSEEVRLAAVYELAGNPDLRKRLQTLISNETDQKVRSVAQCRILLSTLPYAR